MSDAIVAVPRGRRDAVVGHRRPPSPVRYSNTAPRLLSGERQRGDRDAAVEHGLRELVVAAIGIARLDQHARRARTRCARRARRWRAPSRDRARLVALDADPVRVAIDQLADLVDVALGEHLTAVDHDDLARSAPRSRRARGSTRRSSCRPSPSLLIRSTMSTRAIGSTPVSGSSSSRKSGIVGDRGRELRALAHALARSP